MEYSPFKIFIIYVMSIEQIGFCQIPRIQIFPSCIQDIMTKLNFDIPRRQQIINGRCGSIQHNSFIDVFAI